MGQAKTERSLGIVPRLLTMSFLWHPQRDSNPCRHLESPVTSPHGVLSSAWPLVGDLLIRTETR
jgi:hypothetical protein